MQLHGYNEADKVRGKANATTNLDHKAFREKASSHTGYIKYKSVQEQLQKIDEDYKRAFRKAQKDAKEIYNHENNSKNIFSTVVGFFLPRKDTSFVYKSAYNFIPIVQSYSYADCQYNIRKVGDEYRSIKKSLIDTTYKEIFFYDKDYRIYKFINTWKDNRYVYVKKD
ncbi:hypothetical protein FACS1894155_12880 [Bacteroidia bacterium]|nr:hypothetical protein FACS189455_0420 [Bacteroidia bacterium]GHU92899.1 hypothetical protein FACS1894155_12880 [Bacteroidia bacterium]